MKRFEVLFLGEHVQDSSVDFYRCCDQFKKELLRSGYPVDIEIVHWNTAAGIPDVDPLANVEFCSEKAQAQATEAGLTAADFEGLRPTGKEGYRTRDVARALKRRD